MRKFLIIFSFLFLLTYSCKDDSSTKQSNNNDPSQLEKKGKKSTSKGKKDKQKTTVIADPILPDKIIVLKRQPDGKILREETDSENVVVKINQIVNNEFPKIQLLVSVTDRMGNPVEIANTNVFFLKENDEFVKRHNIEEIIQKKNSTSEIPLKTVLAIDKSGSMAFDGKAKVSEENQPLTFAKKASLDFIRQLKTIDEVKVIAFDHNLHDLGTNVDSVKGIEKLTPSGDTALFGALYKSVRQLANVKGSKAVILLTDGKNDLKKSFTSDLKKITLKQGIDLANKLTIPVFTIGFGAGADVATLKKISEETHSTYFGTDKKEDFSFLYESIKHIINNQYIITYRTTSLTPRSVIEVLVFSDSDKRAFINPADLLSKAIQLENRLKELERKEIELSALKEKFQKELNLYQEKLSNLEKLKSQQEKEYKIKLAKLKEQDKYIVKRMKKLLETESEIKKNKKEMEELQEKISNLNNDLDKKRKEVQLRLAELDRKTRLYLAKDKKIEQEAKKLNKKEKVLIDKAKRLTQSQRSISVKEITLEQEKQSIAQESSKLSELKFSLNNRRAEIKAQLAALGNIRKVIWRKEKRFQARQKELDDLTKRLENSKKNFKTEKLAFQEEKKRVIQLKKIIDREKSQVRKFKNLLGDFVSETSSKLESIKDIKPKEQPNKKKPSKSKDQQKTNQQNNKQ